MLISDILYQFCELWVKFVWVLLQNGANTNVSEAHAKPASRPDLRRAGRACWLMAALLGAAAGGLLVNPWWGFAVGLVLVRPSLFSGRCLLASATASRSHGVLCFFTFAGL